MCWFRAVLLLILSATAVRAQTATTFVPGQTLGAAALNTAFAGKLDYPITSLTVTPVPLGASGYTGKALTTNWGVPGDSQPSTNLLSQTVNNTQISFPVGSAIWANRDILTYSSATASASGASYIPRVMTMVATSDRGTASGAPNIWGAIIDAVDTTGHPSSVAGNILGEELDVEAGGLDDASLRQGLVIVGFTRNYPTVPTSEITRAIGMFGGDNGNSFKKGIDFGIVFSQAGIDFTGARSVSSAPAIKLEHGMAISMDESNNTTLIEDGTGTTAFHWQGNPTIAVDPSGNLIFNTNGVVNFLGSNKTFRVIDAGGILLDVIDGSGGTGANRLGLASSATGAPLAIEAIGTDTNINLAVSAKGTGQVQFFPSITGGSGGPLTIANGVSVGGDLTFPGNNVIIVNGSNKVFRANDAGGSLFDAADGSSGTSANWVRLTSSSTGAAPAISTVGSDTNIPLTVSPKGTGALQLNATSITINTSPGVTCSGTPTSSYATVNGIVTHC